MQIERKLKDIPRREIDVLEKVLNKILKNEEHFDSTTEELVGDKWEPKSGIILIYSQGTIKEAAKLVGKGKTHEGNYEIEFKLNLSDDIYSLLLQNLEKQSPILAKSLPKLPSYSSS